MNAAADRPDPASEPAASWRDALPDDAEVVSIIEHQVHTLVHERIEVLREKITLFGAGCRILTKGGRVVGYGLAHPWIQDDIPPLDSLLGAIPPEAGCLFVHDVAILPEARAGNASRGYVDHAARVAARQGLPVLALVSVYGTVDLWRRHGFVPSPSTATSPPTRPLRQHGRLHGAQTGLSRLRCPCRAPDARSWPTMARRYRRP